LERAGFTDEDSRIRSQDIPERMQLRTVPVVPGTEEELDEEAEWIYDTVFKNRPARPQEPVALNPTDPEAPGVPAQPTGWFLFESANSPNSSIINIIYDFLDLSF